MFERFHIDVMDGHFVPNLAMGPAVVKSVRPITSLPFDVHLMIANPDAYLETFVKAGADVLIVHIEVSDNIAATIGKIKELGIKAGVAINPDTPLVSLSEIANIVDMILVMSVHPGFSGQSFIPDAVERVAKIRHLLNTAESEADIAVDGGVGPANAASLIAAGATILAAATSIYGSELGVVAAVENLRRAATNL